LFYQITAYRYEQVQQGRYREFHQFGAELLGAQDAAADVEIISILALFFEKIGVKNLILNLNSIGCPECRKAYNELLKEYLSDKISDMCDTCKTRYDRNPMRILDCKVDSCRAHLINAPALLDHICDDCRAHFEQVTHKLETIGIPYNIDRNIVRGLDYYTKTVFEFVSENIGTKGTVCGGGRYDGLVEEIGGQPTPGVGFALGVERLLLEMESQGIEFPEADAPDIYIGAIGERAGQVAEKLTWQLRSKNIYCIKDIMGRSVKAQMKYADKLNVRYTLILGDNEIDSNKARLKDMKTGETKDISLDTLIDRLVKNKA
jgi:histidyl-tRNA synthetase